MAFTRSLLSRFAVVIVALAASTAVFAAAPVGSAHANGQAIDWQVAISGYDRIQLTVLSPSGEPYTREFKAGEMPSFKISDAAFADGEYRYELRVVPMISAATRAKLQSARNADDAAAVKRIMAEAGLSAEPLVQSGSFVVTGGSVVAPDKNEDGSTGPRRFITNANRPSTPVTNDNVIADDLIVQGSACVGLDCVNNESFGFDTVRLKENNTRIKFDDTSTTAGCPANDWQLTANDACGGSSKFSIEDITGSKVPFTITAGASTNSIFVDSTGRVGLRTSTPVLDVHIATSNTPAIRLEQNSSGGFTAQTWDVAGNEANFFVRDVTSGSRLPFRIRPGAPTSSIDIAADGKVGIGTASPDEFVDAELVQDANTISQVQNTSTGTSAAAVVRAKSDTATVNFQAHASTRTISRFGQALGGWSELLQVAGNGLVMGTLGNTSLILGTNSTARMTIAGTGAITVPGNFTVTGTKNFAVVDPANAKQALYYTALEGPEAGTYYRGTAKTVKGEVVIELPGYFARLTEKERMTVQLTPVGAWGQLYVVEKSPEKLVIRVAEGSPELEFDYLVQGVRKGYLDYEVERTGAFPVQQ
ncbi:MAG TPA: hypothetical protein VJZ00_21025 [Thermoanaerobaculia bacterium]|nr:hypothetical protein [Thermoanaerobaculia bacterium]